MNYNNLTFDSIDHPIKFFDIGRGDTAIFNTVDMMRELIEKSAGSQPVRRMAEELVMDVPDNDKWGEAEAIYNFVRDEVRYTKDPYGLEYTKTPDYIIQLYKEEGRVAGDCDDKTVLGLSLLKSIGFEVAIRIVSLANHRRFSHVYGLVKVNGEWVPFDATRNDKYLGWKPLGVTRQKDTVVGNAEVADLGAINPDRVMEGALIALVSTTVLILFGLRNSKRC